MKVGHHVDLGRRRLGCCWVEALRHVPLMGHHSSAVHLGVRGGRLAKQRRPLVMKTVSRVLLRLEGLRVTCKQVGVFNLKPGLF